jgi:Flp pilus assembly protein TadG
MTSPSGQRAHARSRPPDGRTSRARGRGQALVEFALIVPVLLFLLVVAIDFGRLFYLNVSINNGAREGAAYGARNPNDTTGITTRVRQELSLPAGDTSIAVTKTCSPDCFTNPVVTPPHTIRVTAGTSFSFLTPFINGFFGGPLPMSAAAVAVIP